MITEMGREEILALNPNTVNWYLSTEEFLHIATILGAFWTYDYVAAENGKVGLHAELKSGLHSDGFFVSKILLEPKNILHIMARQIAMKLEKRGLFDLDLADDYVAGVPDGATNLGREIAKMLDVQEAIMQKSDGKISLSTQIGSGRILLIEDFCTRGTGFTEAVLQIRESQPDVHVLPYDPVILNRGGMKWINVLGVGEFDILPMVEKRIQDWQPTDCPLCKFGSKAIKPKATEENWLKITTSQK